MAKKNKPSKNEEKAAKAGMSVKDYNNKKNKGKGKDKSTADIIKEILKATPSQQKVLPAFEGTYTPELQAEDMAQSTALYTPFFQNQIATELEDLNSWSQSENTDYNRNLRRARISFSNAGAAIGTERTTGEGEIATDHTKKVNDTLTGVERAIGTEALTGAGYASQGQEEGSIVGKMKESIQGGQLWYKNQRAQRYYGDSKTYYSQPTGTSLAGTEM